MRKTSLFLGLIPLLLAACSSTPVEPAKAPVTTAAPVAGTQQAPAPSAQTRAAPSKPMAAAHLDPNNPLSKDRSVYFDYDEFIVKHEFAPLIERHGKYLAAHPSVVIKVEGHADERGSAEYNLALGQKRAQAVLGALKIYGVKDSQVEAVSWGEEKPATGTHDEAAWAQNRRADVSYRN
jgi:peptidoglycan-associated lipoprotein